MKTLTQDGNCVQGYSKVILSHSPSCHGGASMDGKSAEFQSQQRQNMRVREVGLITKEF